MQGWLNRRLDLDMNIAIRTLAFDGQTYRLGVGGGVTYESDAAAEFDEICVKAQPFLAVFGIETLPTPNFYDWTGQRWPVMQFIGSCYPSSTAVSSARLGNTTASFSCSKSGWGTTG